MCLVAFAWGVDPENPLVLLANRDEFFARPSAPLGPWSDQPDIIAGRDLHAGGTWLGFHRFNRRFAVVTNVRSAGQPVAVAPRSRGFLVPDFLSSELSCAEFGEELVGREQGAVYDGFNLLLHDGQDLICVSNRADTVAVQPGVHGLSNAALNTPWPKVESIMSGLAGAIEAGESVASMELLLRDGQQVEDSLLPATGVPLHWERRLSAVFIDGDESYGTRAQTSVRIAADGSVQLREWSRDSLKGNWRLQALTF